MNAVPRPAPVPAAAPDDTPLLRTLLLTDLCDSTEIMEKRGDAAAAQIYRDLDRVVLELQQRWRGRLIDRSDGLLLLFERPIDGLGFALDYMKALKDVGARHDVELRARAGLHVGEVLTWRNSVEAVQLGAKPLEVEGLTKPMAARLMTLARPGQILVSAIAEPLAHRAARELGERGDHLLWKSHGYWCFKGVPGRQEVHEVGEAGLAPLRAPRNGPKAWRDIPLWRRPASLAAEVLLLAGLGIGGWYATRPEPAIAFAERDWVVMGDLRNLTGDPRLDESLEQAFRISLEQSRYVNVLSDLKARETLQRMQKPEGTAIDRATASEIAVRDGVRAVILPTVSEVGGRLRVSAEVVDPRTQSTVYALSADGKGIGSVLDSVDEVTGELRGKLGEALAAVDKDSKPLPQVTTSNIDALKAYALGQEAFDESDYEKAERFFRTAILLDPAFAMSYLGVHKALNAQGKPSLGEPYLRKAQALSTKLPPRDQLHVKAWITRVDAPANELEAWQQLAEAYPDYYPATINVGYALFEKNRFDESLNYARRALKTQNPTIGKALMLSGGSLLALNRPQEAFKQYSRANSLNNPAARMGLARTYAGMGMLDKAEAQLEGLESKADDGVTFDDVSLLIDSGHEQQAYVRAQQIALSKELGRTRRQAAMFALSVAATSAGKNKEASDALDRMLALTFPINFNAGSADTVENCYTAGQAGVFFGLIGQRKAARKVHAFVSPKCDVVDDPLVRDLSITLSKLAFEKPATTRFSKSPPLSVLMAGLMPKREPMADWRARAYIEQGCGWCQQPAYVYLMKQQRL